MATPPKKTHCKRGHPFDVPGNTRYSKTKFGKEYRTCRVCVNAQMIASRLQVKIEAFEAYDGCRCACCGVAELIFLTLDHVDGDGGGRDRQLGGSRLCYILKQAGFPPGYQVLCFNCNVAKHWLGICPHQTKKENLTDDARVGPTSA